MGNGKATSAEPKEFKAVSHLGEAIAHRDLLFKLGGEAFGQLNHPCATCANQVVMVVFRAPPG